MPPIVIAFHYRNLDAMGRMICCYAGAKREPISDGRIAVGTALSGGPPHRSQRALLTHWAPASGASVEAHAWEGMLHTGRWEPMRCVALHPGPGDTGALAAAP